LHFLCTQSFFYVIFFLEKIVSGFSSGPRLRLAQRITGTLQRPRPADTGSLYFLPNPQNKKANSHGAKSCNRTQCRRLGSLEAPRRGGRKRERNAGVCTVGRSSSRERRRREEGGGSKARLPVGSQTRNRKKVRFIGIGHWSPRVDLHI
jgi:hypothetical protein